MKSSSEIPIDGSAGIFKPLRMSILRKWFGPSKKEIWEQLCANTGASYIPGSFWKGDKVEATHNDWMMTLDVYEIGRAHV